MRLSISDRDASQRAVPCQKSCAILVCLTLFFITGAAQETCYWPNGVPANGPDSPTYYPCHEGNSTCCAVNEACISNGLCYGSEIDTVYRGGCTNADWIGCPDQYCQSLIPDGWANLWKCHETTGNGVYWWCGQKTATACHTGKGAMTFGVAGGALQTIVPEPGAASSTSLTTSSPSNTATSATSSSASLVGSAPLTITATATSTVENNGGSDKSNKTPVAIGAGVGIPLGIAALGFLGFLIWREKNLRKQHGGEEVTPSRTQLEYSPTSGATTMQQRSPVPPYGELTGDTAERELVAPPPVHEMYTKPGP